MPGSAGWREADSGSGDRGWVHPLPSRDRDAVQHCLRGEAVGKRGVFRDNGSAPGSWLLAAGKQFAEHLGRCAALPASSQKHVSGREPGATFQLADDARVSAIVFNHEADPHRNCESPFGHGLDTLGALQAALVHTRQLTTSDIERLVDAHRRDVESHLAALRASIAALPD